MIIEVTAKLRNVRLSKKPDSKVLDGFSLVAHGNIHEDKRQRWSDGHPVVTSRILSLDGTRIITQNSVYEIE